MELGNGGRDMAMISVDDRGVLDKVSGMHCVALGIS